MVGALRMLRLRFVKRAAWSNPALSSQSHSASKTPMHLQKKTAGRSPPLRKIKPLVVYFLTPPVTRRYHSG
jgi:hypothetical protein